MNCIFCRISKGEIPSAKLFEDAHCFVFLDIQPVNEGHALVIPKSHHETLGDVPEDILGPLLSAAKRVGVGLMEGLGAEGYNIQMNNFGPAGQAVFHAHIHVIPRFSDDSLRLWSGKEYAEGDMERVRKKIQACLTDSA